MGHVSLALDEIGEFFARRYASRLHKPALFGMVSAFVTSAYIRIVGYLVSILH